VAPHANARDAGANASRAAMTAAVVAVGRVAVGIISQFLNR
jgi:hypothetical protein